MKFKNFKTIVSAALLGLSGTATAVDIEFYLPGSMTNEYLGGKAKLFVVTIDGKSCKFGTGQSACTIIDLSPLSSVARVDWHNDINASGQALAKDLVASTAFVVRHENNPDFTSIPLPVGKVRIKELNGVSPGNANHKIGLYLLPSNDLLKLAVTVGGNVKLPSNYFSGLRHYEMASEAITSGTITDFGNSREFPVLAGTYAPMAFKVNAGAAHAAPYFLSGEQAVTVSMGSTTEILVDSTDSHLPMDIINNWQQPIIFPVDGWQTQQ
jgi:hypothetical protein